jgi:peptide/nickel transport system substrate-binding protein
MAIVFNHPMNPFSSGKQINYKLQAIRRLLPTAYSPLPAKRCSLSFACCFLLPLLFILPAVGCKRDKEAGTLVLAIEILPRGFDPRFSSSNTYSARIMQLVYDTLLVKNDNFELTPSLADSFTESVDHKTFTFHLRSGVKFHNGKTLTSADVKYTFDSLLSPALKSPIRGALDKITSIEAPDALTVIFQAKEPFYTFAANLPAIGIIPDGAGTEMSTAPIGSGPYKFISYAEGDTVKLEANKDYWNGAPNIARVHVKIVADNSTRQAELMSGDVDIAYNSGFDPETVRALQGRRGIQVLQTDGVNVDYLGVNLSTLSQMSNQKLRQAVAYAIDREVIINRLLRNQATRAEAILPTKHWAYEKSVTAYEHNIERAKQLLDEAGFADPDGDGAQPRVTIKLMTNTTQITRNIASIMKEQLRQVGINLEIESFEFATMIDKVTKGQFDMYYLRVIGANHNTDVFQFVYHSRYQNTEFNDAIAKLRAENDAAKMQPLFNTLATNLAKQQYCASPLVTSLIEKASSTNDANAKKQIYLDIARQLTDRGGQNRMRYCNPQVDEWIITAEQTNDRALKLELFSKIQKSIAEELPQIYLWYSANVLAASRRVGNIEIDQYGSWYFIPKLTLEEN